MAVPFLLFVGSFVAAVLVRGPLAADIGAICLISAVASLILMGRESWLLWRRHGRKRRAPQRRIVVDGSNVMHWRQPPDLNTVAELVALLHKTGLKPLVWFDANAGYLVADRYMGPDMLARQIGLMPAQVFIAGKGTPADPLLLQAAVDLGVPVVSNDRFRDWVERFPLVQEPAFLMRGQVADGAIRLEPLTAMAAQPA